MAFNEDGDNAPRKENVLPPFILITPLETVTHAPPVQSRLPSKVARLRPKRSSWWLLFLSLGVLGSLLSVMGLLMTTAPAVSHASVTHATATLPPSVTGTATTRPVAVFPPTPTVLLASPTPVITLPANLTLPPLCTPATDATPTPGPSPTVTPATAPTCTPCPYHFTTTTATHAQIKAALDAAATTYHLPQYLVEGIAQLESAWDPNLISCSFDIGLMQLKYGYWQWVDELNVPSCSLQPTAYSPYILEQNALLGAKLLAYLTCYYSFAGDEGGTLDNPGKGTVAYWYQQAQLPYPDTATVTSATTSLCAGVFNDPKQIIYKDLPATAQDRWSCPYTARIGDATLLDVVLATYNQGIGTTNAHGIQNAWYVTATEQDIIQLATS